MTIDKLNDSSVKICLYQADFEKYSINSSEINIKSIKKFLTCISDEISKILNKDISSAKLYVEVFSQKSQCLIFVSAVQDQTKNHKQPPEKLICQFNDFSSLEKFCYALNALYKNSVRNSSLLCGSNKLRLIISLRDEYDTIRYFASGYCSIIPADEINIAVTNEYYREITAKNAVDEILLSIRK